MKYQCLHDDFERGKRVFGFKMSIASKTEVSELPSSGTTIRELPLAVGSFERDFDVL
jgi:hypothetical protein